MNTFIAITLIEGIGLFLLPIIGIPLIVWIIIKLGKYLPDDDDSPRAQGYGYWLDYNCEIEDKKHKGHKKKKKMM